MKTKLDWVDVWFKPTFYLVMWVLVFAIAYHLLDWFTPRDDSDPPNGRSGLKVCVDHLTGCEYVGSMWGCTTPRLDENGKQLCRGNND